ncbi:MAG: Zn-ribbon domain-containing OB-fold protein [Dehalococcoidia bacterium]
MNDWYLPLVDTESEPFWQAAREGRFLIMHCRSCDLPYFYPRRYCPRCWSDETEWREASGRGTVYTYSVVHQNPAPPFRDWCPYAVVIVDLEEGVRVMGNWDRATDLDAIAVGLAVELTFESMNDEISLPRFRPVE